MSEQENSRSPQNSLVLAGASVEKAEEGQEPPEAIPCTNGSSGASVESDMGNNVFSAMEEAVDKAEDTVGEAEEGSSGRGEVECEQQAKKGVCQDIHNGLPCPQDVTCIDLKESQVPRDSVKVEAVLSSDMGTSEVETEGEGDKTEVEKSIGMTSVQDREKQSAVSRVSDGAGNNCREAPAQGESAEHDCEEKEAITKSNKDELASIDASNREQSEALVRREENTPGDRDREANPEARLSKPAESVSVSEECEPWPTEPSEAQAAVPSEPRPAEPSEARPAVPIEPRPAVPSEPWPTVPSEPQPAVPSEARPAVPIEPRPAVPSDPACEAPPPPLLTHNGSVEGREESGRETGGGEVDGGEVDGPPMDPTRDTDSEAGDSVCSDDGEHGEVCRGGGRCPHQEAEAGWEYMVDEEFNVPRRPVFNGATDHLERRSNLKRRASEESEDSKPAKCRRGIQFEGVTVFYFPRSQGFTCVPSQGGSSLGMSRRHSHIRQFSLAEHAVEQRRAHREHLMRLRQQRSAREHGESSSRGSSSEDSEENSEEASDLSDSELDADSYYFLQPLPIRQRRTLLRQAGICHIEGVEKEECKDIRISREMCGCQCKAYCDPDTCQCSQAGIKCQVDRHNFPCGCSREGCSNTYGRIEFNPIRVRTHFIHTLMRLEIEKRQSQQQQQQQQQQQHQQQQQQQQHQQQQHQQQQQEWQQQQQQRAKWLASSSVPSNGFNGGGGSGGGGGSLPFFEGGRDVGSLAVSDVTKFNSSVEMSPCVGAMGTPLYPHFESRQMLGPAAPASVYIQHDAVADYNSGTCSVFAGLGSPFDPSAPYGTCHTFPSSSVVAPQVVAPQVVAPQVVAPQVQSQVPPPQAAPEAYNSLSKFSNASSLVSTPFPYSGAVAPSAVPSGPVSCSYTQNTFCMAGVHDGAAPGGMFGQYPDPGTSAQTLFKGGVSDCADYQPTFEAVSSSPPASADKPSSRYLGPPPSVVGPGKGCTDYPMQATSAAAATAVIDCSPGIEDAYEMNVPASPPALAAEEVGHPEPHLPAHSAGSPSHRGFDASLLSSSSADSGIAASTEEISEATENLGEIVKKSMVETVSA